MPLRDFLTMNNFSLDDFKKWMKEHSDEHALNRPHNSLIGTYVESKVSLKKLMSKIVAEQEIDKRKLAEDFINSGGTITEIEEKNFVIEVSCGSFSVHRYYVRRG